MVALRAGDVAHNARPGDNRIVRALSDDRDRPGAGDRWQWPAGILGCAFWDGLESLTGGDSSPEESGVTVRATCSAFPALSICEAHLAVANLGSTRHHSPAGRRVGQVWSAAGHAAPSGA